MYTRCWEWCRTRWCTQGRVVGPGWVYRPGTPPWVHHSSLHGTTVTLRHHTVTPSPAQQEQEQYTGQSTLIPLGRLVNSAQGDSSLLGRLVNSAQGDSSVPRETGQLCPRRLLCPLGDWSTLPRRLLFLSTPSPLLDLLFAIFLLNLRSEPG